MDNQQERDFAEESYNTGRCPECDNQHPSDEGCKEGNLPVTEHPDRPGKMLGTDIPLGEVIGYFSLEEGIVLDGGEWWNNR